MAPEENLKKNRLRLLNRLVAVFEPIADFSRIVQDGTPA
jgi:glycyl-tRNA synthetase beta subunit